MNRDTAIVMLFTGWTQETAESAVEQWRRAEPQWTADYMLDFLSVQDLERLEAMTDVTQLIVIAPLSVANDVPTGRATTGEEDARKRAGLTACGKCGIL